MQIKLSKHQIMQPLSRHARKKQGAVIIADDRSRFLITI